MAYIVHECVGSLTRYRFMLKHLISPTLRKKGRTVKKKTYADDYCKTNIRQLNYRKFYKGIMHVVVRMIQNTRKICQYAYYLELDVTHLSVVLVIIYVVKCSEEHPQGQEA
jgi:hypothetical protein